MAQIELLSVTEHRSSVDFSR